MGSPNRWVLHASGCPTTRSWSWLILNPIRLTAAEGTRKKDLERLKASEEKSRDLVRAGMWAHPRVTRGTRVGADTVPSQERRLSALEKEQTELRDAITQALGHPGRTGRRMPARGWDESGDDSQATSV